MQKNYWNYKSNKKNNKPLLLSENLFWFIILACCWPLSAHSYVSLLCVHKLQIIHIHRKFPLYLHYYIHLHREGGGSKESNGQETL